MTTRRRELLAVCGLVLLTAGVGLALADSVVWLLLAAVGGVVLYRFDR